MKTSSATAPQAPKRSTAVNCLLVNQFATPGLGSLMAGRRLAGMIELSLAILGFCLFVGWFIQFCLKSYRELLDEPPVPDRFPWLGKVGALVFLTAWLLSWITSISVLRQARKARAEESSSKPLPPRIPT